MESEKVKEIKKGLECCSTLMDNNATSEEQDNSCNECPYRLNDRCSWELDGDALTIINWLESENDTLHTNLCEWRRENQQLKDRIAELEKEKKETPSYSKGYADGIKNTYEVVMPDTLKQFAERLKEKLGSVDLIRGWTVKVFIDETLKEYEK